jgi:Predicted nucleotide-binding protein containing TIR-like domain
MAKPRIFLGSSGKQAKLLQALTHGLEGVADVEPWTTTFNPGTTTLGRLVELTRQVDFAAFVFAQDDWTSTEPGTSEAHATAPGQASPRDNVVFEAGLFGGVLGMERTFILHANGAKLPTDLLGLTCVRYGGSTKAAEVKAVNQKLRKAIEDIGGRSRIEGLWWQFSITVRSALEPSAVSLLRISRDRQRMLEVNGRAWQEDGTLSSRYWSEAAKETEDPAGVFYAWKGERPRDPNAPAIHGTGEIKLDTVDRASGYWITRSDADLTLNARTSGVYVRAESDDLAILDGHDNRARAALIAERIQDWQSMANA